VDCFKVPIEQPENEPWKYIIGTSKWGIKYEIALSLGFRHVCWLSGPYYGAASDATILVASGFKDSLDSNESVMADKIYKGDRRAFLCPLTGTRFSLDDEGKNYNFLVYSGRQAVERLIKRLKNFHVLKDIWRPEIWLHTKCVTAVGKLVNLFLIFEPL
jgi:DDE superfamily endonuclease